MFSPDKFFSFSQKESFSQITVNSAILRVTIDSIFISQFHDSVVVKIMRPYVCDLHSEFSGSFKEEFGKSVTLFGQDNMVILNFDYRPSPSRIAN